MQKPSDTEGIARASEKLYDHGHKMRVKAWHLIQEDRHQEAQQLLESANMCDRSLMWICAKVDSVWKRQ